MQDFEILIPKDVNIPKHLHIRNAVRIIYFPNGHVNVFNTYNGNPNDHIISSEIEFDNLLKTPAALPTGISKEKLDDIKMLLRYLSPKGQTFFNDLIEKPSIKKSSKAVLEKECGRGEKDFVKILGLQISSEGSLVIWKLYSDKLVECMLLKVLPIAFY